jgi:hypothetical protein
MAVSAQNDNNPYGVQLFTVTTPSGSELHLQTQEEADWYESRVVRYTVDNHFPNISDLQDLDRLLMLEVLSYRWGLWMAQGFDYLYTRIDEGQLKNSIKEYSVEIRLLKASLGIDKSTRDKEKGESLSDYTDTLLERAQVFGYHRNEQYAMAVTKIYALRSMVTTYDRCTPEERRTLDLTTDSIFEWIRLEMLKPWDQLSADFRKNQTMWIRSM